MGVGSCDADPPNIEAWRLKLVDAVPWNPLKPPGDRRSPNWSSRPIVADELVELERLGTEAVDGSSCEAPAVETAVRALEEQVP